MYSNGQVPLEDEGLKRWLMLSSHFIKKVDETIAFSNEP